MKIASLFSGIGGFEKGILQANPNIKFVFSSEIDKYARQIYKKNYGVEPYGDITKIKASDIPDHDILCGGFPCQAFSIAGKRRGFEDTRGTLFFEIMRIVEAKRPKLLFLENVKGLLSSKTYITFENILPLLYEEVMSDTQWELQYTPLNNWILFADNIQSYIVTKWPDILEFQKKRSGTYSIKNLEYGCVNLEDCLNTGAKKRLTFLKTQILQILKKISNYQKEQMHLSECNEEDLVSTLNQLCSIENLNKMDIHILEKIMDMCGDVGRLRVQNLDENSIQTRWFTTSMAINWTIEPKIFGYVQELSIIGFILKQLNLSTNLWKQVLSNLIERKESIFYVGTFSIILQTLHEHGYDAEWQVFNSKNHGVPQNRERVFIIGHLRGAGTRPIFPITNSIEEISEERNGNDISTGCISTRNQSGQAQWDGSTTLICHSMLPRSSTSGKGGTGHLQREDEISYCCDAGNSIAVEVNQQIRRLTPSECEFLQSFPRDWTKEGIETFNNLETYYKVYGKKKKANAIKILRTLQQTIGKEQIKEWRFGKSFALWEEEILQPRMHETKLQVEISKGCFSTTRKLQSKAIDYCNRMFSMWKDKKSGYSPQRQEQIEQLFIQLTSSLQKLPYKTTQKRGWMEQKESSKSSEKRMGEICVITEISDTQRYKCLGNAVTVNVIEFIARHIFKMINN